MTLLSNTQSTGPRVHDRTVTGTDFNTYHHVKQSNKHYDLDFVNIDLHVYNSFTHIH